MEGQKKSSPRSIIFLYSSGEADIEQKTAGYKGHVRRPEEVISKINHIFLYSSSLSLARRKYQIIKCEQRLYRNLQEVVSRFAHTQLCLAVKTTHLLVAEGEQKHLKYRGKSRAKCSGRNLATRSVSEGNAPFPPRIKVAHRRPQPARARSGQNVVPATVNRNTSTRASNFHHSGTSGIRRSQAFFGTRQNASLTNFCTLSLGVACSRWQCRRANASLETQEAIEEAPSKGAWRATGLQGV